MPASEPRTALIVGASRGLGLGLAAELTRRGWRVVGTVRDAAGAARLAPVAERVERLDTADPAAIAALRRRLDGEVFDLVFVNAGIKGPDHQDAARADADAVAALFLTNSVAPIAIARAFLDRVHEGDGVIAFMSSDLGNVAGNTDGYLELYRASKAALNSLIRSFIAKLGAAKVTVLAVHPGWVRTDMGGADAPVSVEDSVHGIADLLERRAGSLQHGFVDYRRRELDW